MPANPASSYLRHKSLGCCPRARHLPATQPHLACVRAAAGQSCLSACGTDTPWAGCGSRRTAAGLWPASSCAPTRACPGSQTAVTVKLQWSAGGMMTVDKTMDKTMETHPHVDLSLDLEPSQSSSWIWTSKRRLVNETGSRMSRPTSTS